MDWPRIAADFVRALRGEMSQAAASAALGYKSNVVGTWEAGRRSPTAAETLRLAEVGGKDVGACLKRFMRYHPIFCEGERRWQGREFIADMLTALRGTTPIADIADDVGLSRFAVSRMLSGECQPRLPDFLQLIEATSLRGIDFTSEFVDPTSMPAAADAWDAIESLRTLAYRMPMSEAIRCALELDDYRALKRHEPGWLAERLGIDPDDEEKILRTLLRAGVIQKLDGRLVIVPGRAVDTGYDPKAVHRAKAFWSDEAARRELPASGMHSYLLFTADEELIAEIRQMQIDYYLNLRTLVSSHANAEQICLLSMQLVPLLGPTAPASKTQESGDE